MDLNSYTKKKEILRFNLNQLSAIADDLGLQNQVQQIKRDIKNLDNEMFELVIVGEFSRGKSTFINAMLGRRMLPSRKSPTTAIISKIVYNDEPRYVLSYKNKNSEEIDRDDFFALTAPKQILSDEERAQEQKLLDSIDYAEIGYPLSFCRDNVEIVDTPGTNDLSTVRLNITYEYLNKADAVILLLSATQALTSSEADFLRERIIGNHIQDIFIVIGHKDELPTVEDEQKVLEFVMFNLQKYFPDISFNNRIFLVSSLPTLIFRRVENGEELKPNMLRKKPDSLKDTGFPEFESTLTNFLAQEKGNVKLKKYIYRGVPIIKDLNKDILLRINLLEHSADEIKQKIAALEPDFHRAKRNVEKIVQNMKMCLDGTIKDVENMCEIESENIITAATKAIDDIDGTITNSKVKETVAKAVSAEQNRFLAEIQTKENQFINDALSTAQKSMQRIWADIDESYQQNFNLPVLANNTNALSIDGLIAEVEKDEDDKASWGALGIGGGIGALFAGISFFPVVAALGVGAWFLGFFDDKNEKIKNKAKSYITDHYRKTNKDLMKKMRECYTAQIKSVCQSVEETAQMRIADMQQQLQLVIKEKEDVERDAAKERQILEEKQSLLHKISSNLQSLTD